MVNAQCECFGRARLTGKRRYLLLAKPVGSDNVFFRSEHKASKTAYQPEYANRKCPSVGREISNFENTNACFYDGFVERRASAAPLTP